ncbi:MAG: hypothetical protein HY399_04655 [Elusimicrobia bacterium]|nr:hypothetical protein [Elusimicrobiota bacterium]
MPTHFKNSASKPRSQSSLIKALFYMVFGAGLLYVAIVHRTKLMFGPELFSLRPSTYIFEGRVLDLLDLQPVSQALLTFSATSQPDQQTRSNSDGSFRMELSATPSDGYRVRISHPAHDASFYTASSEDYWNRMQPKERLKLHYQVQESIRWKGEPGKTQKMIVVLSPLIQNR